MSTKLMSAIKSLDRAKLAATRKTERLCASRERMNLRIYKAQQRLERARISLLKAIERLNKAEANLPTVEAKAAELLRKQTEDADRASLKVDGAAYKVTMIQDEPQKPAAGSVEGEGFIAPLAKKALQCVRKALGRQKAGILSPEDGGPAQTILDSLPGNVGDSFVVKWAGGQKEILFEVSELGLEFVVMGGALTSTKKQSRLATVSA
jgi:hypothetical protein